MLCAMLAGDAGLLESLRRDRRIPLRKAAASIDRELPTGQNIVLLQCRPVTVLPSRSQTDSAHGARARGSPGSEPLT